MRITLITTILLFSAAATSQAQKRDSANSARLKADSAAAARLIEQKLGRKVTRSEIVERLRQSGMTRAQVQARLQQAGYDSRLADQYFDVIERGAEPLRGDAPNNFLTALGRIGVAVPLTPEMDIDSLLADSLFMDSLRVDSMDMLPDTSSVFGVQLFRRGGKLFQPAAFGPVDPGYRLGPNDQITLVLTGDVEDAYALTVNREGMLFIPTVGQLSVNGLTLAQLEDRLYTMLARVYSGISRSRNASTRFQVTLGRLRSNQVYVLGDVARPAAYQVSSAGTVLNALYQAGGPSPGGSFRNIEVRRGNEVVQRVDLYDYLLRGDGSSDIRLENQDRIFVPPAGAQVRIEGAVRRPFIYEVKPGEGVRELVAFAGGLNSDAVARRIQIDRILPPGERTPGVVRKLKDVSLSALTQDDPDAVLNDGDVVTVFAISAERRNRVVVDGEVRNPGRYEWSPGLTLGQLIANADGLAETAYTPRILIYRLNEADGTRVVVRASVAADSANNVRSGVAIADQDSVVVFSRRDLTNPQFVSIDGFVKHPDTYPLADGMTLKDLILSAGGFVHGAYVVEAEVSRLPDPLVRSNTTAIVRRIRLEGTSDDSTSKSSVPTTAVPAWYPAADEMVLAHGDRVFIRRAPGYGTVREVKVTGEVALPGTYVLENREERLRDLIDRAGGLTKEAYAPGMRVVREGRLVAADVSESLRKKDSRNNIVLEAGDSIHVPTYDPMVAVTGAVSFEARVLHRPGADLDYYVQQAGGYSNVADKGHVTVTYPNGERAGMKRFLTARSAPKVVPGTVIFVPTKPADRQAGTNWESIIMRTLTLVTTSATLLIALRQL